MCSACTSLTDTIACILKAHTHTQRVEVQSELTLSVNAVFEWLGVFTNSTDTQGKLKLNLHSLSVSELSEYRRITLYFCTLSQSNVYKS
jgi:hypothetical protein